MQFIQRPEDDGMLQRQIRRLPELAHGVGEVKAVSWNVVTAQMRRLTERSYFMAGEWGGRRKTRGGVLVKSVGENV